MRLALLALVLIVGSSALVAASHSPTPSPSNPSTAPSPEPSPGPSASAPHESASPSPTKKSTARSTAAVRVPSAAEREALSQVTFCFADNLLYGFCEPPREGRRRIADRFSVYVTPHDANVTYRILLDEKPLKLNNGKTIRTTDAFVVEHFNVSAARRVQLEVEIQIGNGTAVLTDWGTLQIRKFQSILDDEDDFKDRVERTIREFTQTEWTWFHLRTAAVGLAAIGLAAFAALQRRRERLENERPQVVAY